MKPNEYKMLIELLKEASNILSQAEDNGQPCKDYRYALKDELYGYATLLEEEMV